MVSTRVCGTLSSGSNPDRHPLIKNNGSLPLFFIIMLLRDLNGKRVGKTVVFLRRKAVSEASVENRVVFKER